MNALDPWDDASEIARRLRGPGSVLLVLIGAEAWCDKCRNLRPHFENMQADLPPHFVALWLDLENHAEFLGDYIPESLPEFCVYRSGQLVKKVLLDGSRESLQQVLQTPISLALDGLGDPGIYARLVQEDWAD